MAGKINVDENHDGHRIVSVSHPPLEDHEVATKKYVDDSVVSVGGTVSITSAEVASLVQVASAAATSADGHANAVSGRAVSISAELTSLLASVESRLSTRIDVASATGGGGSVTSAEVQIASAAATSADAHANTASAAATSADNHANTVSARVVSVSSELASLVQIASAAATSADGHANTVSARAVSISNELGSLVQIASAAATSADGHANTVSGRAVSISNELGSLVQIASAAATSADGHANTVSARVVSVSAELVSLIRHPRVTTISSNATWSPNADTDDIYEITAQAADVTTISNPSGTPVNGQKLIIRVTGTAARALTWSGSQWRASSDLALPTTTTTTKTMELGFMYNTTGPYWDLLAKLDNF